MPVYSPLREGHSLTLAATLRLPAISTGHKGPGEIGGRRSRGHSLMLAATLCLSAISTGHKGPGEIGGAEGPEPTRSRSRPRGRGVLFCVPAERHKTR